MDTMGDRIKACRKRIGMTQEELAKALGIQNSAVSKYEKGRVDNLKRSTIAEMARIFGVEPSFLLFGSDSEPIEKAYDRLNPEGQKKVIEYINLLLNGGYMR